MPPQRTQRTQRKDGDSSTRTRPGRKQPSNRMSTTVSAKVHPPAANPLAAQSLELTPPPIPKGAHVMNVENQLDKLPRRPSGSTKIWFMYDYVDPAAKFRMMPLDYDWNNKEDFVDAGEDEQALVDDHEHQKTIPVFVEGYQ
jgi:hypothetical protein